MGEHNQKATTAVTLPYLLLIVLTGHVQNEHPIAERAHGDACLKKRKLSLTELKDTITMN